MSIVKELVEKMMDGDGVHSGQRIKKKDGDLTNHPTVDSIDPISVRGGSPEKDKKDFEKSIDSRSKGGPATDNF